MDASVWIGPEGDFTPDEYAQLRDAGLWPVSLGPLTLRVETAAFVCLSVLQHEQSRSRGEAARSARDSL
jgi:16S rRNA (uracil1498-N3)-methyltransferase